jgi:hypothetical protein
MLQGINSRPDPSSDWSRANGPSHRPGPRPAVGPGPSGSLAVASVACNRVGRSPCRPDERAAMGCRPYFGDVATPPGAHRVGPGGVRFRSLALVIEEDLPVRSPPAIHETRGHASFQAASPPPLRPGILDAIAGFGRWLREAWEPWNPTGPLIRPVLRPPGGGPRAEHPRGGAGCRSRRTILGCGGAACPACSDPNFSEALQAPLGLEAPGLSGDRHPAHGRLGARARGLEPAIAEGDTFRRREGRRGALQDPGTVARTCNEGSSRS